MNKQKTLLILSLILNLLLILAISFVVIVYFNFFGVGDKLGISINNNEENIVSEEEDIEEGVIQEEEDVEDLVDEYADWNTYTNEEMGFLIKYPDTFTYDGDEIALSLVEQEHYNTGKVNCIFISGPVDSYEEAGLSIGYDPVNSGPNNCFRSGVGGGEQYVRDYDVQVGSDVYISRLLTYIGEENERSYVNYSPHLDNPNMDESSYNYFAAQVEYYFENEGTYREILQEILKTFEWL